MTLNITSLESMKNWIHKFPYPTEMLFLKTEITPAKKSAVIIKHNNVIINTNLTNIYEIINTNLTNKPTI